MEREYANPVGRPGKRLGKFDQIQSEWPSTFLDLSRKNFQARLIFHWERIHRKHFGQIDGAVGDPGEPVHGPRLDAAFGGQVEGLDPGELVPPVGELLGQHLAREPLPLPQSVVQALGWATFLAFALAFTTFALPLATAVEALTPRTALRADL